MLELSYAGGSYTLGIERLEAGQTALVDVRQLRDNQVADENRSYLLMQQGVRCTGRSAGRKTLCL